MYDMLAISSVLHSTFTPSLCMHCLRWPLVSRCKATMSCRHWSPHRPSTGSEQKSCIFSWCSGAEQPELSTLVASSTCSSQESLWSSHSRSDSSFSDTLYVILNKCAARRFKINSRSYDDKILMYPVVSHWFYLIDIFTHA